MTQSKIEWTSRVWNPTVGCDRVSRGCDNCYALTMAGRLKAMGKPEYQADGDPRTSGPGFALTLLPDRLDIPLGWRKPGMVFVNSMSDLFHPKVTDEFLAQVVARMAVTPDFVYQVLTKRAPRLRHLMNSFGFREKVLHEIDRLWTSGKASHLPDSFDGSVFQPEWWPLRNVWWGVSAEDQDQADRRIPYLSQVEGNKFVSLEPLLEGVTLRPYFHVDSYDPAEWWVIVGGESGRGARPFDLDWATEVVTWARVRRVPVFVKQLGSVWARENGLKDKGGDPETWPVKFARQFPATMHRS